MMKVAANPTYYAIALEYERGMEAPIFVAKGSIRPSRPSTTRRSP
jgi:flagellar biosynthesis protein FlhB